MRFSSIYQERFDLESLEQLWMDEITN